MPTWLKVVLVAFAVVLAFLTSGAILLYRYVLRHQNEWRQAGRTSSDEGEAFGRGRQLEACVVESLARADRCPAISATCEPSARLFLQHCTLTAQMPADFCKTVPKPGDVLRTSMWAQQECARRHASDAPRCARVITALLDYCGER